jgi:hypothetical protein
MSGNKAMPDKGPDQDKGQPASGYPHEEPTPSKGGAKVPGTGKPSESHNMPRQKPGKSSA